MIHYADGGSETLVGQVLEKLIDSGDLARDEVVVVSKVGYLQGQNYALSRKRSQQGRPFPELVEYGEGLEHCIHPDFLRDQLNRSLERLNLETLAPDKNGKFAAQNPGSYGFFRTLQQPE